MTIKEPLCFSCKHLLFYPRCMSFLKKIPEDIVSGKFIHTKKHPDQDNDIVFEPIKEKT